MAYRKIGHKKGNSHDKKAVKVGERQHDNEK